MEDAFGIVAMVAMTPLVVVQLLGLVFRFKQQTLAEAQVEERAITIEEVSEEEAGHITVFEEGPAHG
jgi:signal transduction histidine kinase